ncbi:hypothetical protein [Haloarcula sediminis]|nr:hypothetical protein [Haloarcula sp. CK38]
MKTKTIDTDDHRGDIKPPECELHLTIWHHSTAERGPSVTWVYEA